MRRIIAVLGDAVIAEDSFKFKIAYETGKAIIDNGYRLQCGGLQGVMRAACMGARASSKYKDGDIIGIIPSFDVNDANEFVDIAIPTGLDLYRNVIVANASAVIAVGGGSGTLCEMTNAWALSRLMVAYSNVEGWSAKVAGLPLDQRVRYAGLDDKVFAVQTAEEAIAIINAKIDDYTVYHKGIKPNL